MKTRQQKIAQEKLEQFTYVDSNGDLCIREDYPANYKLTIAGIKKTLRQWSYFVHYGFFPSGRLRSACANPRNIDPAFLYAPREF